MPPSSVRSRPSPARVVFVGSKALGVRVLDDLAGLIGEPHALVGAITLDDRGDGRSAYEPLLAGASRHGVDAQVVGTTAEFDEAIERWHPDVVIVSGWYRIIDVARHAPARFFGFHASPLPRYRGSAPLVWQILRGEQEIGLSFFELTAGMDEGGIVEQRHAPLGPDETIADALRWVEESTSQMLQSSLAGLLDRTATLTEQPVSGASYTGTRTPEDGLISWVWPARAVHDFVRAQTRPYPGAFTHLPDGTTLTVWRTRVDPREIIGVPGSVVERTEEHVVVACGVGGLRLLEVEAAGQPAAPAPRLLTSLRARLG